jgi:hypothetical protein
MQILVIHPRGSRTIVLIKGAAVFLVLQSCPVTAEYMKWETARVMLSFAVDISAPSFEYPCPSKICRIVWNANPAGLVVKELT